MSETKTKSIPEIMESLDYVLTKLGALNKISGAVNTLGKITDDYARATLAAELGKQISNCHWYASTARDYLDDLEAALPKEIPTIDNDEEVTDDLPFK